MSSVVETAVSLISIFYHKVWGYVQTPEHLVERVPRGEPVPISVVLQSFLVDPPTHICDNIYLGNAMHATTESTLRKYNISTIVNVSREIPCHFQQIEYCWIPVDDVRGSSLEQYLDKACEFLATHHTQSQVSDRGNILIHCFMGASRSVAVLVHYLLRLWPDKCPQEVLAFVKSKRSVVNLNQDFYQELNQLHSGVYT